MQRNRKLIYILNHYSKNSAQHFFHVTNLLFKIADKGVEIVLVIEKCDGFPDFCHPGIRIVVQQKVGKLSRPIELFKILTNLTEEGYNKVFIRISTAAASVAIVVSKFKKLEVYFWHSGTVKEFNDSLPFGKAKIKNYLGSTLPFSFVKTFTTWFVTGPESMKEYYVKEYGVKESKIIILYNDIDLDRFNAISDFEKNELKKELRVDLTKKIILFVHRLSAVRKSLYYLPYIFERFCEENRDYQVLLIGDGSERTELEEGLRRSNLGFVKVLGGMPNSIIQKYYSIADIFINPTYTEGFPRVLIEAMACGLPIVTTNAGGIGDILGPNQKEFMVDKSDRDAFALKMIDLANDDLKLEELAGENLQSVQRFSTLKVADMYIQNIFNQ